MSRDRHRGVPRRTLILRASRRRSASDITGCIAHLLESLISLQSSCDTHGRLGVQDDACGFGYMLHSSIRFYFRDQLRPHVSIHRLSMSSCKNEKSAPMVMGTHRARANLLRGSSSTIAIPKTAFRRFMRVVVCLRETSYASACAGSSRQPPTGQVRFACSRADISFCV